MEEFLEQEFKSFRRCKYLVIYRKNNQPFITSAFLGIANKIIVTSDSVSMIWEAVTSNKQVFILELPPIKKKNRHALFLDRLYKKGWVAKLEDVNILLEEVEQKKELERYKRYIEQRIFEIVE